MELFLFWLIGSVAAGIIAANKGRSGGGYFVLSLLLSPVLGVLIALAVSSNKEALDLETGRSRKCPYCAETVKVEAVKCRYCGSELEPMHPPRGGVTLRLSRNKPAERREPRISSKT